VGSYIRLRLAYCFGAFSSSLLADLRPALFPVAG
jgi:hypothetical protein